MSRKWIPPLPQGWDTVQLRRVSTIYAGGTPDRKNADFWTPGEVPWLNSGAVNQDVIVEPSEYVSMQAADTGATRWVPKNSVVIALAGQGRTKGMAARTEINATLNQSLSAIVPGKAIDYRYLHYWLKANYRSIRGLAGGDLRDGLNLEHISSIYLPLPPIDDQIGIADYLDHETAEIDAFVTDQLFLIEKLKERWNASIISAVQPQLLLGGDRGDGSVPGGLRRSWTETRLKTTIDSSTNGAWGDDPDQTGIARRCIRVADFDKAQGLIHDRNITCRSYPAWQTESLALRENDLLIEKSGGGPGSPVGNVVLYEGKGGDMYSNFVARIRLRQGMDPLFALYLHKALYFSGVTQRSIKQTTGIQNLDSASYFNERVWIPPVEEQIELGTMLHHRRGVLEIAIRTVEESIELSRERRAALISAAVTGQIDVTAKHTPVAEQLEAELAEAR